MAGEQRPWRRDSSRAVRRRYGRAAGPARGAARRGTEADPASSSSCKPQFWTACVDPNFAQFLSTIEIYPLGCLVRYLICQAMPS